MKPTVRTFVLCFTVALATGLSNVSLAASGGGADVSGEDGFDAHATLGTAVGQKNFADMEPNPGTPDSIDFFHWAMTLSLGVGYTIDQLQLSASTAFVNIEEEPFRREPTLQWRGTFLGARWNQALLDESLRVSPFLDVALPTGRVLWDSELILAPILGADIEYTVVDRVTFGLGASVRRNIHANKGYAPSPDASRSMGDSPRADVLADVTDVIREGASQTGPHLIRPDGFELAAKTRDVVSVGASVAVQVIDPLSVRLGYAYHRFSGYDRESPQSGDPFRGPVSETTPESGAPVGHFQSSTLDVIYRPIEQLSVGGGIATTQPTRNLDNDSWRFPLWNTVGEAPNFSKFRLYVRYRY